MRQSPAPKRVRKPDIEPGLPRQVFYVMGVSPCPYIPGREERKIVTEIAGPDAADRYALLSRTGFRRSHNFAYRPACSGCSACVPVRIVVAEFTPRRSLRRVARINATVSGEAQPPRATPEQYAVFARYIASRHGGGEMAGMAFTDFRSMVEQTRVDTQMIEFRDTSGRLIAGCLIDWLPDGPSAVYSFFDPTLERRGLGNFMILWLIEAARERGLPYLYLGYWIDESPKMIYKTRFRPIEGFGVDGWRLIEGLP